MKSALVTSACLTLALSPVMGGPHDHHAHSHRTYNNDDHHVHDIGTRESFLNRLVIAPEGYGSTANIRAVQNAAGAANTVVMLGKVEYALGDSTLEAGTKNQLTALLLQSGIPLGPDTLVAVLGYADPTGRANANYHLSGTRAELVRQHLEHFNVQHRIGLHTTSIAMGEEVKLCQHSLGHNRVAEVWLINLAPSGGQFAPGSAPLSEHTRHEPVAHDSGSCGVSCRSSSPKIAAPSYSDQVRTLPEPSVSATADHGHTHDGKCNHDTETAPDPEMITKLQQLGFNVETVENRIVGGAEVTALPVGAIIQGNGKTYVLAKNDQNPPQFERWEVNLGRSDGNYVEAVTGVFPGDLILINPPVRN